MDRWRNSIAGAPIIVECTVNYEVHCCKHTNLFYVLLLKEIVNLSEETILFFRFVSERSSLLKWSSYENVVSSSKKCGTFMNAFPIMNDPCSFCFVCQSDVKKPRSTKYLHTVVLQETGSTVTKTVQLTLKQSAVSSTAARMNSRLETPSSHSPTPPGSPSVLNVSVNSYCEVTFIFFCSLEMQCKGFSALPSYSPT